MVDNVNVDRCPVKFRSTHKRAAALLGFSLLGGNKARSDTIHSQVNTIKGVFQIKYRANQIPYPIKMCNL